MRYTLTLILLFFALLTQGQVTNLGTLTGFHSQGYTSPDLPVSSTTTSFSTVALYSAGGRPLALALQPTTSRTGNNLKFSFTATQTGRMYATASTSTIEVYVQGEKRYTALLTIKYTGTAPGSNPIVVPVVPDTNEYATVVRLNRVTNPINTSLAGKLNTTTYNTDKAAQATLDAGQSSSIASNRAAVIAAQATATNAVANAQTIILASYKGPWQANTTYAAGDQVTQGGNTYRRKVSGTSGATFDPTQWDILAQGGSVADGTITQAKLATDVAGKLTSLLDVTGVAQIDSYPLDFTPLTNQGGANNIYVNVVPVSRSGKLNSLRVKTAVGSTVTVYVYNVVGVSSPTFTLLYTYPTFVTTSQTQTQNFTDGFVIPAGAYVGIKSTGSLFFGGTNYTWSVNAGTHNQFQLSYDFTVNTTTTAGLQGRVGTLEGSVGGFDARITAADNAIGYDIIDNYPIDFAALTNQGGANTTYINNVPLTASGKLASLRVKAAVGSTVTPYAYSVTQGSTPSFTLLYTYPSFVTTSQTHTQTFTDTYAIPAGAFIAFRSTGALFFAGTGTGYNVSQPNVTSITLAVDFVINRRINPALTGRVAANEQAIQANAAAIATLQSSTATAPIALKPAVLYRNNFTALTDFQPTSWSISGGGAVPSGTGSGNALWLKKRYQVSPRTMTLDMSFGTGTVFYIDTAPIDYQQGDGAFAVDLSSNRLIAYSRNNSTQALTEVASTTLPALNTARRFTVALSINGWTSTLSVADQTSGTVLATLNYTLQTASLVLEPRQQDSYKLYVQSGATAGVKLYSMTITSKAKPMLWLGGDSITEGVYFSNATYDQRYANLLRTALRGNVLISARGGAVLQDIADKLETEVAQIRPEYVMLTIGTNQGGFSQAALTTIVQRAQQLGAVVILNHVPSRGSGMEHIATNNTIDAVCAATGAIRGAQFDVATAVSNDPTQGANSSLYYDTNVHPNPAGQAAMFARFAIDLPWLTY